VLSWAVGASYLLCFRPDLSIALNNWILQRETMQGRMFLANDNGPEGFQAFGNEMAIFCARSCTVEELSMNGEMNFWMCDSRWDGYRMHVCSARFWPTRSYVVRAQRR
jgi:hypothetical protein